MSEDETHRRVLERAKDDAQFLEYDLLKHITTMSLVALGGVLSLTQSDAEFEARTMVVPVLLIATGGAFALTCIEQIVKSKRTGKPLGRYYSWWRALATGGFSMGIGAFLALFLELFQ